MAQDLKELFKNEQNLSKQKMPKGHEARFLNKLDEALPEQQSKKRFSFLNIAASTIVLLGLCISAYLVGNIGGDDSEKGVVETDTNSIKSISPQLKKVEDYYLANINLELSKIKYTPETKELFDGYVTRLGDLSKEYELLSDELINNGPNEKTVTALIDNLKLRLNLLYRLKEKLNELNTETLDASQV